MASVSGGKVRQLERPPPATACAAASPPLILCIAFDAMRDSLDGSPRRVRSQSISSMSQLLLQGWTMLADSCPDCGVPLMRHPDGSTLLCVNCGRDTTAGTGDGGEAGAAQLAPPPGADHGSVAATSAPGRTGAVGPAANGIAVSEDEGVSAEGEVGEEEEEEGLLQPPLPLRLRLQQAAAATTPVGSRDNVSGGGGGTDSNGQAGMAPQPQPSHTAPAAAAAPAGASSHNQGTLDAHRGHPSRSIHSRDSTQRQRQQQQQQQERDTSSAIAELMLEGWAMLQDHCPRCLNPLLRSRNGRIYCAGCRLYAVREGEQQPSQQLSQQQQQQGQRQEQASPARAVPSPEQHQPWQKHAESATSATAATTTPTTAAVAARLPPAASPHPTHSQQAAPIATTPRTAAAAAVSHQPAPQPSAATAAAPLHHHLPSVDAAAAAVAAHLEAAAAGLPTASPVEAGQLLALLQQGAATLQSLAKCHRCLSGQP